MSDTNGAGNGAGRTDEKVRVAIVGVGNCANSFIQGVHYYKDADPSEEVPGLMHVDLGGYHVRDVEFVAAFDIDSEKVGKDLSEAIWSGQNDTIKFAEVPEVGVKVERGMTHDGLGKYLKEKITKAPGETADVVGIAPRAIRVVILSIGLLFAKGASLGDFELLEPAVYVLAALSLITVFQRIFHVRSELTKPVTETA